MKYSYVIKQLLLTFFIGFSTVSLLFAQDTASSYKKTVHTFNEAWNTGEYILLEQTVHPKYFKKEGDLEIIGIEPLKEYVKNYRKSMPDVEITYVDEVYGKEKAAIRFTLEGTPLESGKKFKAEGIVIFRFVDGKIIEDKSVFDQLSSLQQQGYKVVPPSEK